MKKKFIAVYALIGVLALGSTALTSCVDDNESASVTAIRDAKAEQMKAYASYQTALANYQNAQANYQQALADEKNQQVAEDKETWAYELESIKKQYEKEIASYEQQIATAKQELAAALGNYRKEYLTNYENAAGKVAEINKEITDNLYLIAQLKNNLISLNAANALSNYQDSVAIAAEQAKIDTYNKYGESNLDELEAELAALEVQIDEQTQKSAQADKKLADAKEAFKKEVEPIKGYGSLTEPTLATVLAADTLISDFADVTLPISGERLPDQYFTTTTEWAEGAENLNLTDASLTKYSTLIPSAVTKTENALAAEVYEAEKALGSADDAATGSTAYAIYNNYGEDVKTAQTAYDNALKGTDEDAIETARQNLAKAKADQQQYQENGLQRAIDAVNDAKEMQATFANVKKAFEGDTYKAYETAITAALTGENAKAMVAAKEESNAINVTKTQLNASETALNTLISKLNGTNANKDVKELILTAEKTIAEKQEDIANRKNTANTVVTDSNDPAYQLAVDDAVAALESENDLLEAELEAAKKLAEVAKAELDAALTADTTTDTPATDTPAEGEETPAE